MDSLTAARAQMEVSLGFHMIFAALGIAMPLLMVIAEGLWLKTKRPHYRELARRWGKTTALLFAIGAVSGTALSFELGLLWPRFMATCGAVLGPAFTLEGYAFFVEAVFVGLYLYGWEKLSPRAHWLCGIPIAVTGLVSGILVVGANAWMQHPGAGISLEDGRVIGATATSTFESPMWLTMSLHSSFACYVSVGFAAAGVYAIGALRGKHDAYHRSGMAIAIGVASVAAIFQVVTGDMSAKAVAAHEPVKLAASEAHFDTASGAPLLIGGIPDPDTGEVTLALKLPKMLSFMAKGDFDAEVQGLHDFPRDEWPNVILSHLAFQVMVAAGFALLGAAALYWFLRWRKKAENKWLLRLLVFSSPLGFVALEAGWVVTEAGRQPWIVHGLLRTKDAVTQAHHVDATFFAFTALYVGLGAGLVFLLRYLARKPLEIAEGPS